MKKYLTIIIFVVSAIIAILTIVAFVFIIGIVKNKNLHAGATEATLGEKMKEKDNLMLYSKKVAEIKSIQSSINNYFVEKNKIDMFVSYLEGTGSNFGSEVVVKRIEIPTDKKGLVLLELSISGNFGSVMNTMKYIENMPYQINISQVSLNIDSSQVEQEKVKTIPKWKSSIIFTVLSLN